MKKIYLLIFIILALSLIPRIWELSQFPPVIVDEPAYLRDIDKMIADNNYYPANFQWDGSQATIYYLPTIFLIKTFISDKLLALRISSVIFSLLALIPFFFLTRKYTNNIVAFSATIMFSYSYYFLQFSRVGWGVVYATTIGLYLIWIVDNLQQKNELFKILVSGILAGLLLYGYRAGEVYILASSVLLFINIVRVNKSFYKSLAKIFLFLTIFLLTSLPWLMNINSNIDFFILRQNVVHINNVELPYHGMTDAGEIIVYQIITTIKSWLFLLPSDSINIENQRYLPLQHTIINPLLIPFFISGLIIGLLNFRKLYVWFFIYIGGLILGQILTFDPPNGARGLIVLPAIYLFCALSLYLIYKKLELYYFSKYLVVAGAIMIAFYDFYFYISWMKWIMV